MSIHPEHPFLEPAHLRRPMRRIRARWPVGVSIWTAHGRRPVGLTVSSMVFADGEPAEVVGLIDPDSELLDAVVDSRRFAVSVLSSGQAASADAFAGLTPAPGGPFTVGDWKDSEYGPWLANGVVTLGVTLSDASTDSGWSRLVRGEVSQVLDPLSDGAEPLMHLRGGYRGL